MKKRIIFILAISIVLWLALCIAASSVKYHPREKAIAATTARPKAITLDGHVYSLSTFSWDLFNVAFARDMWRQSEGRYSLGSWGSNNRTAEAKNRLAPEAFHYFREFIERRDGYPRHNAIAKWIKKDITIRVGWPWTDRNHASFNATTTETVAQLRSEIEALTGIRLTVIVEGSADITIIPAPFTPDKGYKTKAYAGHHGGRGTDWEFKDYILTGIEFAPRSPRSVDGVLLTNEDNAIQSASCFVPETAGKDEPRLLVECLVRALGVPGVARTSDKSLFAEPGGQLVVLRAMENVVNPDAIVEPPALYKLKQSAASAPILSEFDRLVLQILYCDAIHAGADQNEVAGQLLREHLCINQFFMEAK